MSDQPTEKVIAFVKPVIFGGVLHNDGHVLFVKGKAVEDELRNVGRLLEEWLIAEVPEHWCVGIMVWEGTCENLWCADHGADWEPRFFGAWRLPTPEELQELVPKIPLKGNVE